MYDNSGKSRIRPLLTIMIHPQEVLRVEFLPVHDTQSTSARHTIYKPAQWTFRLFSAPFAHTVPAKQVPTPKTERSAQLTNN